MVNANTFLGDNALSGTTGSANTAVGASTLVNARSGSNDTATVFFALQNNTTGFAEYG